MAARVRQWPVAGEQWRIDRLRERDVHGVVGADVVSHLPCPSCQIDVGMTMEVEIGEISKRFGGTPGTHLVRAHEPPQGLDDLHVDQMRRMEFLGVAEEPGLYASANRGLQQELKQSRGVEHDHAESRSSRMTTAAGVFRARRLRP